MNQCAHTDILESHPDHFLWSGYLFAFKKSFVRCCLISDYHFLKENDIHTVSDLQANIDESKAQLSDLERERKTLSNRIRRPKSLEDESQNKESRKAISKQMKPVREKLRRAEKILEKSPHLYELLKQERELERKARARYLDRSR